jgi:hypothetical protein
MGHGFLLVPPRAEPILDGSGPSRVALLNLFTLALSARAVGSLVSPTTTPIAVPTSPRPTTSVGPAPPRAQPDS